MATHGFLLLLLVANSKALWDSNFGVGSWSSSRARAFECLAAGFFCESCTSSVHCTGPGATPTVFPCNTGQVCGGTAPTFICMDYVGATSEGGCDCDSVGNSGFLLDPYDQAMAKYILCVNFPTLPEAQFFLSCNEGETFSIEDGVCVPVTTTTTTTQAPLDDIDCSTEGIGQHTTDPTCKTYGVCFSQSLPAILTSCGDGEAFDSSKPGCVPECDLGPAIFTCPADKMGALPDTSDCSIFHVCLAGVAVTPASGAPCPDGQVFESVSMACVDPSPDVVCPPEINPCWAEYCEACGGTCPPIDITDTTSSATSSTTSTVTPSESSSTTTSSTTISTSSSTTPSSTTSSTTTPSTTITSTTTTSTTTTPTSTSTTTTATTTTPTTTSTTTTPTTTSTTTPSTTTPQHCNNSPGAFANPDDCKR
ncbi:unnamed protein product [Meganyctiphanes norvegica]|uniref:Chitin-binding type-2 domain-containing protein n=1 Tax=Meganyctiphanes norvegica TaxID=48144 RepID=A0AAV2PLK4_MEGNR